MTRQIARKVLSLHVPTWGPARPLFGLLYRAHVAAREGMIWGLRFCWYEPLFRSQCERIGSNFQMESLPYITGRGRIIVGDRVRLSGKSSIGFSDRLGARPELVIGDDTFIGHGCHFNLAESIRIGSGCLLASGVSIRDLDGHPLDAGERRAGRSTPRQAVRPVVIENDVWIGAGAIVLKGVTVGARAVVGAGAVVSRDVPSDCVVAGNPARVVKGLPVAETIAPAVIREVPLAGAA
jgi:acetyltransferase-like isoleucine patch superfamily enzyme